MSDELAAGAMSLEEPEIVGAISDPQASETAPETADEVPDGTIEASGGVKFVPLAAVQEARGKAKEAKAELEASKTRMAQMERAVAEYEALKPKLQEAMPIIEAVRRRPDLVKMAYEPAPEPPKPTGPLSVEDAAEYAKDMDLYTADGQPDTARAQRLAARQQAIAEKQARALVAPYEQATLTQQARTMREQVGAMKDAQGRTVDAAALDNMFQSVPPELAARPEVASVLYYAAKGYAEHHAKGRGDAAPPVVLSESLGAPKSDPASLNAIDERFMRAADIKKSDYAKTASRFVPGRVNTLED